MAQGGFAGEGVVPPERQLEKFRGMTTCPTYNLNGDPRSALAAVASLAIDRKLFVSKNICHGVIHDAALHAEDGALRHHSRSLERLWRGVEVYLNDGRAPRRPWPRNGENTALTVHLVARDGRLEPVATDDALARASAAGLDLVAMDDGSPPTCRLLPPRKGESRDERGKEFHDPLAARRAIDESIGEWAEVELYREKGAWGSRLAPGSSTRIIVGYDRERFVATLTGAGREM